MAANTAPRYRAMKGRGHWYVIDTATGGVPMTGMVMVGARQLADRLNRQTER